MEWSTTKPDKPGWYWWRTILPEGQAWQAQHKENR
jgi:hypothetical protein